MTSEITERETGGYKFQQPALPGLYNEPVFLLMLPLLPLPPDPHTLCGPQV